MKGVSPSDHIVVPHTSLTEDLLQAVVESFVLREGTDYGEQERTLEDKVSRVLAQLKRGDANIVYDPESQSVTIVPARAA
jgi:uncharacterized protein YheU (UPF0270 family)